MKIHLDKHRCVGAGQCAWVAPQVFDQSDTDGTVRLLREDPPIELHDFVREAARVCPARVIHLIEENDR